MICSPTKHSGVFKNLEVLVFEWREKPEHPNKNFPEQRREPTTRRDLSAVTIAPPLLPQSGIKGLNSRARSFWKDVGRVKHTVSPANRTQ